MPRHESVVVNREAVFQGLHLLVQDARTDAPRLTLMDGKKRLAGPVLTTKDEFSQMFARCIGSLPTPKQIALAEGHGQGSYAVAVSSVACVQAWLLSLVRQAEKDPKREREA